MRRGGIQQVALRADRAAQRGDDLLTDGVQRRVGDLGEQLREVVEQHPRAVGQHRHRGVRAHGPQRLHAVLGHGGQEDPQFLLGVAEDLLAAGDRHRGVHDVLALRQFLEVDDTGVQPFLVRALRGQLGLDLIVLDDAPADGVDQEHPARLQAALAHHCRGVEVEHAGFGGQYHQPVVGHPEPPRAQTVAVEHRADDPAVGEGDARRTVPRLGQRRVVLVEGPAGRIHLRIVLPRLRDHHQHGVRQRPATEVEQFQHLVETRRVTRGRGADREQPVEVAGDQIAAQQGFSGPHPVAVALDRVDLAVVGDEPEGVRQWPAREGVR